MRERVVELTMVTMTTVVVDPLVAKITAGAKATAGGCGGDGGGDGNDGVDGNGDGGVEDKLSVGDDADSELPRAAERSKAVETGLVESEPVTQRWRCRYVDCAKDDVAAAGVVRDSGVRGEGRRRRGAEDLYVAVGVAYLRRIREGLVRLALSKAGAEYWPFSGCVPRMDLERGWRVETTAVNKSWRGLARVSDSVDRDGDGHAERETGDGHADRETVDGHADRDEEVSDDGDQHGADRREVDGAEGSGARDDGGGNNIISI